MALTSYVIDMGIAIGISGTEYQSECIALRGISVAVRVLV